jgi:hypothetical protein
MLGYRYDESSTVFPGDPLAWGQWDSIIVYGVKWENNGKSGYRKFRQIVESIRRCELKDGDGGVDVNAQTRWMTYQVRHVLELISFAKDDDSSELGPTRVFAVRFVDKFEDENEITWSAVHGTTASWDCRRRGHPSEVFAIVSRPSLLSDHSPVSFEDVGMYPELDTIFTFDDEISVGVVVFRMVGFFWQGHFKSCERLKMRVEELMRWREQSRDHGPQGSE